MLRSKFVAAAGLISLLTLLSKILGFGRETALAAVFGASYATDAFLVASVVPFLVALMLAAALTSALIPVYSEAMGSSDPDGARRLASSVFLLSGLGLLLLALAVALAAPWLIRLLAPGFPADMAAEAARLMRWMMPALVFIGLGGVLSGILQAHLRFALPALVTVVHNGVMIGTIFWLGPRYGIMSAALGFTVGTLSYLLVQRPGLRLAGAGLGRVLAGGGFARRLLADPDVRRVGWLLLPILAGSAAQNVNLIVDRILASGLPEGSISALNFANKLVGLPLGLLIVPVATVLYPALARLAGGGDADQGAFRRTVAGAAGALTFLVLPVTAALVVLNEPVVRLLFERGAFDAQDTRLTTVATVFYGLGLFGLAQTELFRRALYARQNTWAAVRITLVAVVINIILNLVLVGPLAHGGLALATSLSVTLSAVLLYFTLRREVGPLGGRTLAWSGLRVAIAATVMGFVLRVAYDTTAVLWSGDGLVVQVIQLAVAGAAGGVAYLGVAWVLRVPEMGLLLRGMRKMSNGGLLGWLARNPTPPGV